MSRNEPLIRTRFDVTSTAEDVVAGVDLSGVRAIVTGASSGIGLETARVLAGAGARVTLAVRNPGAGERAADAAQGSDARKRMQVSFLDLVDQNSVSEFVRTWNEPLHLLINNAATIPAGLERTAEGWELQFATNHLGHFALSVGLHDALATGASERGEARIVSVTSGAHMRSPVVFDDIHYQHRAYDMQQAYAQSKTANVLFTVDATRRWAGDGIFANAVNPGGVAGTGLNRNASQKQKDYLIEAEAAGVFKWKTIGQGAATTLVAAIDPAFSNTGGHYLDEGQEVETVPNDAALFGNSHHVKEWAVDPENARRLWDVSADHLT